VAALKERALSILAQAERAQDFRACASLLRETRSAIELLARMVAHAQQAMAEAERDQPNQNGESEYDLSKLSDEELEILEPLLAKASRQPSDFEEEQRQRLAEMISILMEVGMFDVPGMPPRRIEQSPGDITA
jgi:hypothetical protein